MQAFYSDQFVLPLPPGHRFPMQKYRLLRDAIAEHLPGVRLHEAPAASATELAYAHHPDYIDAVAKGTLSPAQLREIGFPWSPSMAERAVRSVGATLAAARCALTEGLAANLAGGTHHAYGDRGSGFCVFNDLAVTARVLQAEWGRGVRRPALQVAIIDLDVHQGNGTAHIFRNDDSVFTLSLHGSNNFPFQKERSDLDCALPDGCSDDAYMEALEQSLSELEARFAPGLVLYQAGADVHAGDRLGRLNLSDDGMQMRDRRIFDWCYQRRLPCVMTMGGGYGQDIGSTIRVQLNSYRLAVECWQRFNR